MERFRDKASRQASSGQQLPQWQRMQPGGARLPSCTAVSLHRHLALILLLLLECRMG